MDLNVVIYIAPPLVIETVRKNDEGNEIKEYSGLLYDLWVRIKKKLIEDNVVNNVKETFVGSNYNITMKQTYDDIIEGKYDIGIGYFSIVQSRNKTHFTRPIYLNKFCCAYIPDSVNYMLVAKSMLRGFILPFIVGIILSLFIATLLNYILKGKNKQQSWNVLTAIIFRHQGKYATTKGVLSFSILLLSLFFFVYLQSEMTTTLAIVKEKAYTNKINRDSIIGQKILVPKGYATSIVWKKYGARIEEMQGNDIVKEYKDNKDKYFGFFDDLEVLKLFKLDEPNLIITDENFGFDEIAWPVRNSDNVTKVLFHINNEIVKQQDNDTILQSCKSYFMKDAYLCQL